MEEGVLTKAECEAVDWGKSKKGVLIIKRDFTKGVTRFFEKAYERSNVHENAEYQKFVEENSWWLSDYALFMAVKDRFDGGNGNCGQMISSCAGDLPWIITVKSCIMILNSSSICNSSSMNSGCS